MKRRDFTLGATGLFAVVSSKANAAWSFSDVLSSNSGAPGGKPGKNLVLHLSGMSQEVHADSFHGDTHVNPKYSAITQRKSVMTLNKDGTGSVVGRVIHTISGLHDYGLIGKADLPLHEISECTYRLTYDIDHANNISIYVSPGSWHGVYTVGPRKGLSFSYDISLDNPENKYLEGDFSKNLSEVSMSTAGILKVKSLLGGGETENHSYSVDIRGRKQ